MLGRNLVLVFGQDTHSVSCRATVRAGYIRGLIQMGRSVFDLYRNHGGDGCIHGFPIDRGWFQLGDTNEFRYSGRNRSVTSPDTCSRCVSGTIVSSRDRILHSVAARLLHLVGFCQNDHSVLCAHQSYRRNTSGMVFGQLLDDISLRKYTPLE